MGGFSEDDRTIAIVEQLAQRTLNIHVLDHTGFSNNKVNPCPAEKVSLTRKCHNHTLQTKPRHLEEETQNT